MSSMHPYRSRDGLLSSADPEVVARWNARESEMLTEAWSWTERLREIGVKFAAPDDGWVHRNIDGSGHASVSWYPLFDDRPEVGDLVAFGTPPSGYYGVNHYVPRIDSAQGWKGDFRVPKGQVESASQGYRLGRVTKVERGGRLIPYVRYHYEDTGIRVPPIPPQPWWRRLLRSIR